MANAKALHAKYDSTLKLPELSANAAIIISNKIFCPPTFNKYLPGSSFALLKALITTKPAEDITIKIKLKPAQLNTPIPGIKAATRNKKATVDTAPKRNKYFTLL